MALNESAMSELLDALRAGGDLDVVREALGLVLQALIEAEATQQIGAGRYERSEQRTTHRNGSAPAAAVHQGRRCRAAASPSCGRARSSRRCWSRAAASTGPCWRWSWRPMCTAPPPARSTTWSRPWASTAGISKSEVSRICAELDAEVAAFRSRSLAHTAFPYLFLDATYLKARVDGRVVSPRGGDRHRGDRRRRPRGPGPGRR